LVGAGRDGPSPRARATAWLTILSSYFSQSPRGRPQKPRCTLRRDGHGRIRSRPLPVPSGSTAGDALRNTLDLARHADALGLRRYWLAEHHNASGLASSAPAIVIGQVAGLGQAPGTDPRTAAALRRSREAVSADNFPEQLAELTRYLDDDSPPRPGFGGTIRAIPTNVPSPELWLLGSGDSGGALLAAKPSSRPPAYVSRRQLSRSA